MTKTIWMFPGQGSQAIGMGQDLLEIPSAKAKFDQASEILGWSVSDRCTGDIETLSQTRYTQPCLYVVEAAITDELKAQGKIPDYVAGHSLGEYVALYTAGVFDFATGLKLVQQRANLMNEASGGKMAAMIGFKRDELTAALDETDGVSLANDNSSAQVVITGEPAAVDTIMANVKAKRAIPLTVSGAFHSPYMADAAGQFNKILTEATFTDASIPVLSNTEPTASSDASEIKNRLIAQMTGSVRWRETMANFAGDGVTEAIEIGPGKVLTGLLKREHKAIALQNITGAAALNG
ncbi:MAG: ACP S-malonyltransferase [Cyanobacteria bacterium P01_H01_bin.130]